MDPLGFQEGRLGFFLGGASSCDIGSVLRSAVLHSVLMMMRSFVGTSETKCARRFYSMFQAAARRRSRLLEPQFCRGGVFCSRDGRSRGAQWLVGLGKEPDCKVIDFGSRVQSCV